MIIHAFERVRNRIVAEHLFPVGVDIEGGYRATLSYNAFVRVQAELAQKNPLFRRFDTLTPRDYTAIKTMWQSAFHRSEIPIPTFVTHKHNSIWDFYKAVSYDYKKKKFIEAE